MKRSKPNSRHSDLSDQEKEAAEVSVDFANSHMFKLAEQLNELGLSYQSSLNIEVGITIVWAARVLVLRSLAFQRRAPDRAQWLDTCGREFDDAVKWFAESFPDRMPPQFKTEVH